MEYEYKQVAALIVLHDYYLSNTGMAGFCFSASIILSWTGK